MFNMKYKQKLITRWNRSNFMGRPMELQLAKQYVPEYAALLFRAAEGGTKERPGRRGAPGHRLLRRVSQTPHARESASPHGPRPTSSPNHHLLPPDALPSATGELPPPSTVLPQAIRRFSPSPAASFSGAGELPPPQQP
jgi:hypothetical protein